MVKILSRILGRVTSKAFLFSVALCLLTMRAGEIPTSLIAFVSFFPIVVLFQDSRISDLQDQLHDLKEEVAKSKRV